MSNKIINQLRKKFNKFQIDGYVIPKNDEFFSEFSNKDRLNICSNFSGSAGYAVILKKKNFLFVDGRYTIQAKLESGKNFKILDYNKIINCKMFQNLTLGIDPSLFTSNQIKKFFRKNSKIKQINENLVDMITSNTRFKSKPFFSLNDKIVGENYIKKINNVANYLKKKKSDFLFVSAPENVAWLLNIRGTDNPNSPIPNCRLIVSNNKKIFIFSNKRNLLRLIKERKIKKSQIIDPRNFEKFFNKLDKGKIIIDRKSCSIFNENIIKKNFKILKFQDPIYQLKSIKNSTEINNMINAHISDGVAVTKFIHWITVINKKRITEFEAQKKLENFRRQNKRYLYPSFNTIAGTGSNGAIVHYRANKKKAKFINKKDIFLFDSGGQYKYGTTDITRTICFSKPKKIIKDIFTKVLKGHIAVVTADLIKNPNGMMIDRLARKELKKNNLDYAHGTGHGVGFFLNVHEGPQSLSKFNKIKLKEGMILSNEPGFYKKNKFGIRIENLIYVKNIKNKICFENLTLAPIDKELINFDSLNTREKSYLFEYHLKVYMTISKYLSNTQKKWLASFI